MTYDEVRYKEGAYSLIIGIRGFRRDFAVVHQCYLEKDLELFEAGDLTEVGEKGITLRSASSLL